VGALVESGALVDVAIAVVLIEALGLFLARRLAGRGPGLAPMLPSLASGLCLMLALRAALSDAPWPWIVTALAVSGVAHVADLARRQG
jgi:hypothetical protein